MPYLCSTDRSGGWEQGDQEDIPQGIGKRRRFEEEAEGGGYGDGILNDHGDYGQEGYGEDEATYEY